VLILRKKIEDRKVVGEYPWRVDSYPALSVSGRHAAIDGEVLAGNPDIADLFEVIGMDGVTNATAG
jgi:hypothetical protein